MQVYDHVYSQNINFDNIVLKKYSFFFYISWKVAVLIIQGFRLFYLCHKYDVNPALSNWHKQKNSSESPNSFKTGKILIIMCDYYNSIWKLHLSSVNYDMIYPHTKDPPVASNLILDIYLVFTNFPCTRTVKHTPTNLKVLANSGYVPFQTEKNIYRIPRWRYVWLYIFGCWKSTGCARVTGELGASAGHLGLC